MKWGISLIFAAAILVYVFLSRQSFEISSDLLKFSVRIDNPLVAAIVVESEDSAATESAVKLLKTRLETLPTGFLSKVEERRPEEQVFLRKRLPLFLSLEDLHKVHTYLKEAIQFEKDLFNPFSLFKGKDIQEPTFDFESLAESLDRHRPFKVFPGGNYSTWEGKKWVLLLYGTSKFGEVAREFYSALPQTLEVEIPQAKARLAHSGDKALSEVFEFPPPPLVLLADSREEANRLAEQLREQNRALKVKTLEDYVPKDQPEKVKVLKAIKKFLTPQMVKFLGDTEKTWATGFLNLEVFEPFEEKDLPLSIISRFTEDEKPAGTVLYVQTSPDEKAEVKGALKTSHPELEILDPVF